MESSLERERRQAHAYLDRLPEAQISALRGLLESMLSPLERALATAPLDDEPLTPEEASAIEEGITSLERNGGSSMEEVLAELGFTEDDLRGTAKEK